MHEFISMCHLIVFVGMDQCDHFASFQDCIQLVYRLCAKTMNFYNSLILDFCVITPMMLDVFHNNSSGHIYSGCSLNILETYTITKKTIYMVDIDTVFL